MYPHERSLVKQLANQPFALIGVNSDSKKRVLEAMERENITWPSFFNGGSTRGPISKAWGVHSWPTIYVLDHRGVIRFKNVRGEALTEAVNELIKEARAALASDIKSSVPEVRGIAAFRMGKYKVAGALAAIKPLLKDPNKQVRQRAALGLVLLGQPIDNLQSSIRNAVTDVQPEVRIAALEVLGHVKDRHILNQAIQAVDDANVQVRRAAVHVLGQLGAPEAIPVLAKAVESTDQTTARNAAYALADIKTPDAVATLKALADKPDQPARVWIAAALYRAGAPGTEARFKKLLADSDSRIRRQAVLVLPTLPHFDPLDLMLSVLDDQDLQVGKKVREYLAASKSPRAQKALHKYLQQRIDQLVSMLVSRDIRQHAKARSELLSLGPAAAPMLLERIDSKLPRMAAYTLGNVIGVLDNPKVIAPLAEKLENPKLAPTVRTAYEASLRAFGMQARPAVKQLIASEEGAVRLSAVRILLTARDADAIRILKKSLQDTDPDVRAYAAYILALQRNPAALPVLRELVAKQEPAQLQLAAFGLCFYGKDSDVPLLVALLSSEDKNIRAVGISSLGRLRSKAATNAVLRAAKTTPALRSAAMNVLYRQGTPAAARALGEFLDSGTPEVQKQALQWLLRMRVSTAREIARKYQERQAARTETKTGSKSKSGSEKGDQ